MSRFIVLLLALIFALSIPARANDEKKGHWGLRGDFGAAEIPGSLVERINPFSFTLPRISGEATNAGIVRFNAKGAPSFSLQYSQGNLGIAGARQEGDLYTTVDGRARFKGFMATKYFNFVARRYLNAGFAAGGGVGELAARYSRFSRYADYPPSFEEKTFAHIVPLFETFVYGNVRPVRFFSAGPFVGIRNASVVKGVAVHFHFDSGKRR